MVMVVLALTESVIEMTRRGKEGKMQRDRARERDLRIDDMIHDEAKVSMIHDVENNIDGKRSKKWGRSTTCGPLPLRPSSTLSLFDPLPILRSVRLVLDEKMMVKLNDVAISAFLLDIALAFDEDFEAEFVENHDVRMEVSLLRKNLKPELAEQLNDKERVATTLENPYLLEMVDDCLAPLG
ncbi:hypothetical protein ACLOJK_019378 [Asimina triloba]